jgi:uncharacterized protein YjbI with pentapeptide repeats
MRVLAVAGAALALGFAPLPSAASPTSTSKPTTAELQRQKLQQEVRKLEHENANQRGLRGFVAAYGSLAGLVAGVAALFGVLVTYRSQKRDESRQRELDRAQRESERVQRNDEGRRRLDERFSAVLADLGADSDAIQAAAVVSLLTFLRPGREEYRHQVRLVTLANLKVDHSAAVVTLLIRVLEAALRTPEPLDAVERDLSHATLRRIDLSHLDLGEADVSFAQMKGADLTDAILTRARGYRVQLQGARLCGSEADLREVRFGGEADLSDANFRNANLRAAHLEDAILTRAQFQQCRLQSAHLDRTDLRGARFEQANVNDTYFLNATLDEVALKSISRANNWQKAHLSPEDQERLAALSGGAMTAQETRGRDEGTLQPRRRATDTQHTTDGL